MCGANQRFHLRKSEWHEQPFTANDYEEIGNNLLPSEIENTALKEEKKKREA